MTRPANVITASCCDSWWTGLSGAHCSACHRTFSGITAFDLHRDGSHAKGTRQCVDPETVGLVPANRPWVGWGRPGTWAGPEKDED